MNTHITAPRHFRLYGAALAMAALLAVLLAVTMTAGPAMAQDPNVGGIGIGPVDPRTGENEDFYKEPYPCSEEAKPDASTVSVIRGSTKASAPDFYAVFDAFWDYEVGHLSDNFCPPSVTVTTKVVDDEVVTESTRSDANIHISKTAFSIPDSYQVTVVDSDETNGNPSTVTAPKIDLADYPFLRQAVSAVKPGPDSTEANPTTVFADNKVWWVRLNEPGTTADETSPLKIAFSAALMKDGDWFRDDNEDGVSDGDPVQFLYSAVHVLEAGIPQEVHVVGADFFAFEERATDTPMDKAKWSNLDTAAESEINLAIGEYKPMQFVFTKPGEYLVQAHMQAYVRQEAPTGAPVTWTPINSGVTLTSPTEWYTFHVGPVADVGVSLTHTDETPNDPATTVTDGTASFTVTATNSGPAPAKGVVVEVSLPVGLTYVADATHTGVTYECGVISWKVGDLTASGASSSKTLSFNATVDDAGPKSLTVEAEVHSSTVDENEENDTASVEVLTNSTVVTPPFFMGVERDIVEHAIAGAHAGNPVAAKNPDGRALTYSLTGRCSDWFQVHSNGQIVLAAGKTLDYDEQSAFHLTLHVSDGVNVSGVADTAIDDSEPVTINVTDTPDDAVHPTVSFTLSNDDPGNYPNLDLNNPVVGSSIRITPEVQNLPAGVQPNHFVWTNSLGGRQESWGNESDVVTVVSSPGAVTYTVHIKWQGGGITASYTINWVAATK